MRRIRAGMKLVRHRNVARTLPRQLRLSVTPNYTLGSWRGSHP